MFECVYLCSCNITGVRACVCVCVRACMQKLASHYLNVCVLIHKTKCDLRLSVCVSFVNIYVMLCLSYP